ncbi:MAG TPA: OmpA family protein [Clostridiaceae bacterium]|nr:OmpA family protein [Clostridiaceae bacterium]
MRDRRKKSEESGGAAEWLLTYSDLVTLLLTFFVMLFSMASIDQHKFKEVAYSMRSSFLNISGGDKLLANPGEAVLPIPYGTDFIDTSGNEISSGDEDSSQLEDVKLQNVKAQVEKAIEKHNLKEYVNIIEEEQSLILRLDSVILFDLGKADIKASGKEILKELGGMFKELDNEITIEGHTDDLPINTMLFPSNWELSTKRATNVVVFLIENCGLDPKKLTASGRGEFKPIMPNDSPENRQKNRRIDIIVNKYIIR